MFLCSVTEITENTEYLVEFNAGENKLAMLILLSPDFPMEKPLLKITPSISHQWVNENSEIVGAPGFLNVNLLYFFLLSQKHAILLKIVSLVTVYCILRFR